ncbi:unnamed protein product, partial [Prorocentrum cordatum]
GLPRGRQPLRARCVLARAAGRTMRRGAAAALLATLAWAVLHGRPGPGCAAARRLGTRVGRALPQIAAPRGTGCSRDAAWRRGRRPARGAAAEGREGGASAAGVDLGVSQAGLMRAATQSFRDAEAKQREFEEKVEELERIQEELALAMGLSSLEELRSRAEELGYDSVEEPGAEAIPVGSSRLPRLRMLSGGASSRAASAVASGRMPKHLPDAISGVAGAVVGLS